MACVGTDASGLHSVCYCFLRYQYSRPCTQSRCLFPAGLGYPASFLPHGGAGLSRLRSQPDSSKSPLAFYRRGKVSFGGARSFTSSFAARNTSLYDRSPSCVPARYHEDTCIYGAAEEGCVGNRTSDGESCRKLTIAHFMPWSGMGGVEVATLRMIDATRE